MDRIVYRQGSEILVNTQTFAHQDCPTITGLSNGGFVVSWQDLSGQGGDSSGYGIKAQVFNASGTKVGTEFLVNTQTLGSQQRPTITGLSGGGFVVSWVDPSGDGSGDSIKAQVFNDSGTKVGTEFLVNTQTFNYQQQQTITGLSAGGFVIAWADYSGQGSDISGSAIKAQVFSASGAKVGTEFLVNTQTFAYQDFPTITGLSNGGFVVSWQDLSGQGGDSSSYGIKAQVFNASGTKVGTEFLVNTQTLGSQQRPTITGLSGGGFVVSWVDPSGDGSGDSIKAQVFNDSGTKVGTEFLVNTQAASNQQQPTVTDLSDGSFVISWQDSSGLGGDSFGYGIKAQVFNANGTKVGAEFLVNTQVVNEQQQVTITGLSNGGFAVSWMDSSGQGGDISGSGIKAQVFEIRPANVAPVALGDIFSLDEDTSLLVPAAQGLLTNDTDTDGDALASVLVSGPTHGALQLETDGSFTYTPNADFSGTDSFTYRANDGTADSALATVSLTINPVNDAPVLTGIPAALTSGVEDVAYVIAAADLLQGFTDTDGDALTVADLSVQGAMVVDNRDGTYTLMTAPDVHGRMTLTYDVVDGQGGRVAASRGFSLLPVNDAPVAQDATLSTDEDTALTGALVATDVDSRSLTYTLGAGPQNGTLVLNPDGSFTYTPNVDFNGTDSFAYRANDGRADSALATVSLTINPVNDAPVAQGVSLSTDEDTVLTGTLAAMDVDSASLIYAVGGGPAHGTLHLEAGGSFTYTPNANFHGADSFTYSASDGALSSSPTTVNLSIRSVNDRPILTGIPVTLPAGREDTPYTISNADLLAGVTDSDGDTLTVQNLHANVLSPVPANADGSGWTYTPPANYTGSILLTYTITDGQGGYYLPFQTITIAPVNDAPVAQDDSGTVKQGANVTLDVLANDTDVDGDTLSLQPGSLVVDPGQGTAAIVDGRLVFTAAADFLGTATIAYTVMDGVGPEALSDVGTAVITVTSRYNEVSGQDGVDDALTGTAEADRLRGLSGNDTLLGLGGNDELIGGSGDDRLDGGSGADILLGGGGDDTYIVDIPRDIIYESFGEGFDTIRTIFTDYTLGDNVEALIYTGPSTFGGYGNALANLIIGGDGGNILDGRAGADTMVGGLRSDSYVVDDSGDVVNELADQGDDRVRTSLATYVLADNVEMLTYTGSGYFTGTGNALANLITGGDRGNRLDGGAGADTLVGGLGADTYVVDSVADIVVEKLGGGIDRVLVGVSYTLGDNVENLGMGTSASLDGTGNALANLLVGNKGNNVLDGRAGTDTLTGGLGRDTFAFSTALGAGNVDRITDFVAADDTIRLDGAVFTDLVNGTLATSAFRDLATGPADADDRILYDAATGALSFDADGSGATAAVQFAILDTRPALTAANVTVIGGLPGSGGDPGPNVVGGATPGNDVLVGTSADELLDGGAGADTLRGAAGDDTYVVENAGDVVVELPGEGRDTVRTSLAAYTLTGNVEALTFTGSGGFSGGGNGLANVLTGGRSSDRLDGGAGADTLIGGLGNDTYIVDNAGDVVVEQADEGVDRVLAGVSYTLGDNIENLGMGTSASLSGTGNALANLLVGNNGNNVLDGRGGADTLTGGLGRDTFVLRAGETIGDTVTDFVRGTDTLAFYGFGTDAVLSHGSGSDLYTVTSGDGLTSGSFRLTGVGNLDLSMGVANTDARFFA